MSEISGQGEEGWCTVYKKNYLAQLTQAYGAERFIITTAALTQTPPPPPQKPQVSQVKQ